MTSTLQVIPIAAVGVSGSFAWGREHRPDAAFGLNDSDYWAAHTGLDVTPIDSVLIGLTYGFERYTSEQRSRQANPGPQFDDPTRDWFAHVQEDMHTAGATMELTELTPNASLRLAYDFMRSTADHAYALPVVSSLATLEPLVPVLNEIQRATATLRYALGARVDLAVGYSYERYAVEDFARSPAALDSPLIDRYINLTNVFSPYRAHMGTVRILYHW